MTFETQSAEEMARDVLTQLADRWDCTEGTLPSTLVLPLCTLAAKTQRMLIDAVPKLLVDETSGPWIDVAAEAVGLYRKAGAIAHCVITFVGKADTVIPCDTQLMTDDGLVFSLAVDVTLDAFGDGAGDAYAAAVGTAYNIDAGDLVRPAVSLPSGVSFTNAAATGGVDMETDAAFFGRLDAHRKRPPTSGNASHYETWALETSGVGFVRVVPLADGRGTVTVLLLDADGAPADADTIDTTKAYIETLRPIGATVTVDAPTAVPLTIAATVTLDATTDAATVTALYEAALADLLRTQAAVWAVEGGVGYSLSYSRVLVLLASISGVMDVPSMTINGAEASVSLDGDEVATLEGVTLSVAD